MRLNVIIGVIFLNIILALGYVYAASDYVHHETGFTMTAPKDWKQISLPVSDVMTKIIWSKTGENDIPYISIRIGELPKDVNTTKDFADMIYSIYLMKSEGVGLRVIERPHEVLINNITLIRLVTDSDVTAVNGEKFILRNATYLLTKGNMGIQLFVSDKKDNFLDTEQEVKESIGAIKLGE